MIEILWFALVPLLAVVTYLTFRIGTSSTFRQTLISAAPWLVESWTASPNFVYHFAHASCSWIVLHVVYSLAPNYLAIAVAYGFLVAVVKEGVFDATFELPVQTWKDFWGDLSGYAVGEAAYLLGFALGGVT